MEDKCVIYAISCLCHPEDGILYVGKTSQGAQARLQGHLREARYGSALAVHRWMRRHGEGNILSTVIESLAEDATERELLARETEWLRFFRRSGKTMLNVNLPLRVYEDRSRPPVAVRPPAQLPEGVVL